MDELINIGKSVSTFGIKGELKVISDFELLDKAYVVGNEILINNITHVISGVRYHKNYCLLKIDNLENINDVLEYVGYNIYIKRSALNLSADEYLYKDLIDCDIVDDNEVLGKVKRVEYGPNIVYLRVLEKKEFLIPLINEYVKEINITKKEIKTSNAKNLII